MTRSNVDSEAVESYHFASGVVLGVISFVIAWVILTTLFNSQNVYVFTGTNEEILFHLLSIFIGSLLLSFFVMVPLLQFLGFWISRLLKLNFEKRFVGRSYKENKEELVISVLCLFIVIISGLLFCFWPFDFITTIASFAAGPVGYFWLLHRNREKNLQQDSKVEKAFFTTSHYWTIGSFILTLVLCQIIIFYEATVKEHSYAFDVEKLLLIVKFSSSMVLGLLVGVFCEFFAKKYPLN